MDFSLTIRELEEEKERIDTAITTLRSLNGNGAQPHTDRIVSTKLVRRELSPAARRRISLAQKRRWRKSRKDAAAS